MADLLTIENLINLLILIFLESVLGFDNLLYISIESRRAPPERQDQLRKWGIVIAIVLRILLLFIMLHLIDALSEPLLSFHWTGIFEGTFTFSSLVFILGGAFLMYTAVKEIGHLLSIEHLDDENQDRKSKSSLGVLGMIVAMNLVFSFDTILSALAISDVFIVLAAAILVSGLLMVLLAGTVAEFLQKNRKYEVLGLFILLLVGVVLLGEGGHSAHLSAFGFAVEPMSKTTFYFALIVLVVVDVLQTRYQKKLARIRGQSLNNTEE